MLDIVSIFSIVTAIIVVGFAGELFFKKTGIPMFIFLIFMGILIGPVFGFLSRANLLPSLVVFAELTLLMVLFYGGMDTGLGVALKGGGGRALIQVFIYMIGSTIAIALLVSLLLGWDLLSSFIFASMMGGETTAAVVIPLSRSLKLPEVTVAFLTLESTMSSILSIILFFAFVGAYQTGAANWAGSFQTVASNFSVGIVLGAALSIAWVFILNRFQQRAYTYVLTLGLVFATYVISNRLGGSGELSVLIFGIILGNYQLLNGLGNWHLSMDVLQKKLGLFQEEISFLMETLFFVFLGLNVSISGSQIFANLTIGIEVLLVLMLFRIISTTLSTKGSELRQNSREIILMCAQGLVPATLAIIAVGEGLPHADSYLNIVTYVIVLTNVVTAIGSITRLRSQKLGFRDFMSSLDYQYHKGSTDEARAPRAEYASES
ncbi:MAG: cation:proton antiporter [Nitrososphaerota archaeon]|nr:cation:proton antiporter [Nitrososphaerota archaeon]MDG7024639.1 cation:proton antiporter [Nitrososphaerota archaeon]